MMKIAIDIRTTNKPKSGVGYYVSNLVDQIAQIDHQNKYYMICNDKECSLDKDSFECYRTWISNENHLCGDFWENFLLPRSLVQKEVDLFHGPSFMIPLRKTKFRKVVTIYDIVCYTYPETVPFKYAQYMRMLIKFVAKKADKIITTSNSTKNDLMEKLGVLEQKIEVVYGAASDAFVPAVSNHGLLELKRKLGIRDRYILFVGNLEPRKNLVRLMEAFSMVLPKLKGTHQLVICGKKGWLFHSIVKYHEQWKESKDILMTSYLGEKELLTLYQGAEMFVFPTLYEGFGLPPLEAMKCGIPVITSRASSLPEIVGDSALFVDPLDVADISKAILCMATSENLRNELREKGLKRAEGFSWEKAAKQTISVYNSLL